MGPGTSPRTLTKNLAQVLITFLKIRSQGQKLELPNEKGLQEKIPTQDLENIPMISVPIQLDQNTDSQSPSRRDTTRISNLAQAITKPTLF